MELDSDSTRIRLGFGCSFAAKTLPILIPIGAMLPGERNSEKIGLSKITSPCGTSVKNLGENNPRVSSRAVGDGGVRLPVGRSARNFLPSHTRVRQLILKCLPPAQRGTFGASFQDEVRGGKMDDDALVCGTPIRWVCNALGLQDCDGCEQLCTMSDMFPAGVGNKIATSV